MFSHESSTKIATVLAFYSVQFVLFTRVVEVKIEALKMTEISAGEINPIPKSARMSNVTYSPEDKR